MNDVLELADLAGVSLHLQIGHIFLLELFLIAGLLLSNL